MKKILQVLIPFLVIVCCLLTYLIFSSPSPEWAGISQNGKWKAKLMKMHEGSAWVYDGRFYWNGSKQEKRDVRITFTQYRVNGKYGAGDRKGHRKERISANSTAFVDMTGEPKKNDHVVAIIHWSEKGKRHEATVQLKRVQQGIWGQLESM